MSSAHFTSVTESLRTTWLRWRVLQSNTATRAQRTSALLTRVIRATWYWTSWPRRLSCIVCSGRCCRSSSASPSFLSTFSASTLELIDTKTTTPAVLCHPHLNDGWSVSATVPWSSPVKNKPHSSRNQRQHHRLVINICMFFTIQAIFTASWICITVMYNCIYYVKYWCAVRMYKSFIFLCALCPNVFFVLIWCRIVQLITPSCVHIGAHIQLVYTIQRA